MRRESSSKRSSPSGTPARPASASRWTTAFVPPPSAISAVIALSSAAAVTTCVGRRPSCASATARAPVASAAAARAGSPAGIAAVPGSDIPIASTSAAIVDAVPSSLQCPAPCTFAASYSSNSACVMRPARTSSTWCQRSVPAPSSRPRQYAGSAGPAVSAIAGTSAESAPISCAGTVLSQPPMRTTASSG